MGFLKSLINTLLKKSNTNLPPIPTLEERQSKTQRFLYGYGKNFHCTYEQYNRFQRAMNPKRIGRIVSVDQQRMSMQIHGSYHPDLIYDVHLDYCNCKDFQNRQLPCKHMYRLALEIGIVTPQWDLSGLTPEVREKLSLLSENQQKALLRLINKQGSKLTAFSTSKRSVPTALVTAGFISEVPYDYILDKNFLKKDLLALLSVSNYCPVSNADKKSDIINYIVQNEHKLAKTMYKKFYCVEYSDMLSNNLGFIQRYLSEKYEQ